MTRELMVQLTRQSPNKGVAKRIYGRTWRLLRENDWRVVTVDGGESSIFPRFNPKRPDSDVCLIPQEVLNRLGNGAERKLRAMIRAKPEGVSARSRLGETGLGYVAGAIRALD